MTVFISYRHTDREQAFYLQKKLNQSSIQTYLDVLDYESQTTDDITTVITERINACTHLMALVSQSTADSWWVPFEIGEATITNRRICSYQIGNNKLPAYLNKWPKLHSSSDVDLFILAYKNEGKATRDLILKDVGIESMTIDSIKQSAEMFHKDLKQMLKQS